MSNDQFNILIKRLDVIDKRLDVVEKRLDGIDKNIAILNKKLQNRELTINAMHSDIKSIKVYLGITDSNNPSDRSSLKNQCHSIIETII